VHHGREIIAKKMSLAAAKSYIAKVSRGVKGFSQRSRPAEQRSTLLSVGSRMMHMLGAYVDMPGDQVKSLLQTLSASDLMRLERSLGSIAEDSAGLLKFVRRELGSRAG